MSDEHTVSFLRDMRAELGDSWRDNMRKAALDVAIAALGGGWLPIESAPKYTELLVYDNRSKEFAIGYVYEFTKGTHWMPLPAPPSKEG